jgi:uncharacterized protein
MRTTIALAAALLAAALPSTALAQNPPACTILPDGVCTIGEIQGPVADTDNGATHRSAFAPPSGTGLGATVVTRGVVRQKILSRTAAGVTNHGFFLQSTPGTSDGNPLTSDGIFVFQNRFPDLIGGYVPQVGDEILIRGRVSEFFSLTQLSSASLVQLVRTGVDVDAEAPSIDAAPPSVLADANRWWERREGMSVRVPAGFLATSARDVFASTADGEAWFMSDELPIADRRDPFARRAFRDPHPLDDHHPPLFDNGNGYRVMLASLGVKFTAGDSTELIAPVRTFDRLRSDVAGGVYFSFNKYSVQVAQQPVLRQGADPSRNAPPRRPDRDDEYSVANYNVENLYDFRDDPTDGCDFAGNTGCPGVSPPFDYVPASDAEYRAKLVEQAEQIDEDLHRPDILLVQEAEDQDICSVQAGALACAPWGSDGRPDTLQELALEIEKRSGARYAAVLDRDGADDRGIVSGFLYRTDRVELAEARADDPVLGSSPAVVYRAPGLPYNTHVQNPKVLNADLPADVDRSTGTDGSDVYTRPPQVARFLVWRDRVGRGRPVELVAFSNHFSSTPNARVGQRTEQSRYGAALVEAASGEGRSARRARVLFGGDLNVFPRPDDPFAPGHPLFPSDQLGPLYDEAGMENLWDELRRRVPASAYTYVFEGQAQTLDHQFVSRQLERDLEQVRVAHINADWPADFGGDGARGASDHDPVVSRFELSSGDDDDD